MKLYPHKLPAYHVYPTIKSLCYPMEHPHGNKKGKRRRVYFKDRNTKHGTISDQVVEVDGVYMSYRAFVYFRDKEEENERKLLLSVHKLFERLFNKDNNPFDLRGLR